MLLAGLQSRLAQEAVRLTPARAAGPAATTSAHRHPESLQRNLQQLQEGTGLGQEQLAALLLRYPAALDLRPATVVDHLARLAELLKLEPEQAAAVVSIPPCRRAALPPCRPATPTGSPAARAGPASTELSPSAGSAMG